jgi:acetoin utilization protein AcuC
LSSQGEDSIRIMVPAPEVLLCTGEPLRRYGFPDGHPLSVDRQQAFLDEALRRGLTGGVRRLAPRVAAADELLGFHTGAYIERVMRGSTLGEGFLDYGDTPCFPGIFEAAGAVAGTALDALSQVAAGEALRSFQPIGGLHHARRDAAAGFCVINDVGIVVERLRRDHRVQRIAYVDIDVHHGDGVFYAYEDDADLIVVDIHEDGRFLYPGTGHASERGIGRGEGRKLNLPLQPGATDADFLRAWGEAEEFLRAQRPQFVLLQAGVDSLRGDPLAHLALTPRSHALVTARLCRLANELCQGRLMVFGGGGYDLGNIAQGWSTVLEELLRGSWR